MANHGHCGAGTSRLRCRDVPSAVGVVCRLPCDRSRRPGVREFTDRTPLAGAAAGAVMSESTRIVGGGTAIVAPCSDGISTYLQPGHNPRRERKYQNSKLRAMTQYSYCAPPVWRPRV